METRVAAISIIVENPESVEKLNALLHEAGKYIIGRMGVPYREKNISIIMIAINAPQDYISEITGKIGRLDGVKSEFEYDSVHFTDGFYILIKEGKQGLADGCGQVLIPATMDKVYVPFNSLVVYENEGKYGFAMLGYDVYTETVYDDYDVIDENLEVIKDGVKGYIDFEGNFTQDEDEKFFNCSC